MDYHKIVSGNFKAGNDQTSPTNSKPLCKLTVLTPSSRNQSREIGHRKQKTKLFSKPVGYKCDNLLVRASYKFILKIFSGR